MDVKGFDLVDFHAHILPGADHGSDSVKTSIAQLKIASSHGVKRIIATPHFYPHRHTLERFLKRRQNSVDALMQEYDSSLPVFKLGAEVLLCEGLENFEGLEELCIMGTKTILIELPFSDFRTEYCDTVESIIDLGFDVVLAHVDRYPQANIELLHSIGVNKFQINAVSLATLFKKKHLFNWVEKGLVVGLGSDIHGADTKAYKCFNKAISALGDRTKSIKDKSDEIWNNIV